jgi:hypothetical protein
MVFECNGKLKRFLVITSCADLDINSFESEEQNFGITGYTIRPETFERKTFKI